MSETARGFIIIMVVGLVILAAAALADRRTRLRSTPGLVDSELSGATSISLKLASASLATHDKQRSLARDAAVLVCDDPVETVRELLPIWAALPQWQWLVIAAPSFDQSVIDALNANLAAGTRQVQAVTGGVDARTQLAELTGTTAQPRSELQAGAVTATDLGHIKLSMASPSGMHLVANSEP